MFSRWVKNARAAKHKVMVQLVDEVTGEVLEMDLSPLLIAYLINGDIPIGTVCSIRNIYDPTQEVEIDYKQVYTQGFTTVQISYDTKLHISLNGPFTVNDTPSGYLITRKEQ